MIKIRVFSSFSRSDFDSSEPFIRTSELKDDPDYNNLYCLDSSVLPTSTIESPQATIMAVARHILQEIS